MVQTKIAPADIAESTLLGEQRLTLHNVSWETYEKILGAFGEHRAVRFHYDQGVLEFMVPLEAHENTSDVIGDFIKALVIESGLNIKSMASTTLRRSALLKGAEPDKCYYIQNEPLVRGRTVDLEKDPPPDLVVEIDITHADIDKNTLYASMGVPEFWRFNGSVLTIYQLEQNQYCEVNLSPTFPWVSKEVFYHFLQQGKTLGEAQALRELKGWVQQQMGSSS
ncbi:MAG: Uma2 family endonuclease [Acaryochloris sp. SU_5_25]|nr:Uma2 family endonuclease [Acaryochloris sp. SU_5_25]